MSARKVGQQKILENICLIYLLFCLYQFKLIFVLSKSVLKYCSLIFNKYDTHCKGWLCGIIVHRLLPTAPDKSSCMIIMLKAPFVASS